MIIQDVSKYTKQNINLIVVCVSFKLNNIFITINQFTKFLEVFKLNRLLKSYSCGLENFKNKDKTSLKAYNELINKLQLFLLQSNINKIHVVFKSNKRIKYIFLSTLLNSIFNSKTIKILSIYMDLSSPFNGCKLQKHKFL